MQDIVYKLVPNLQESKKSSYNRFWYVKLVSTNTILINLPDELKRETEFYRSRGLSCPKDILANNEIVDIKKNQNENQNDTDFHRFDEQVSLNY